MTDMQDYVGKRIRLRKIVLARMVGLRIKAQILQIFLYKYCYKKRTAFIPARTLLI